MLAVEIHQVNSTSSDLGFDLSMAFLEHSDTSYLAHLLEGDEGLALGEQVAELLPLPMREKWRRDFAKRSNQ